MTKYASMLTKTMTVAELFQITSGDEERYSDPSFWHLLTRAKMTEAKTQVLSLAPDLRDLLNMTSLKPDANSFLFRTLLERFEDKWDVTVKVDGGRVFALPQYKNLLDPNASMFDSATRVDEYGFNILESRPHHSNVGVHYATAGDDVIHMTGYWDGYFLITLETFSGDDVVVGSKEIDCVASGSGSDRVKGGGGDDQLLGGSGRDRLKGGDGDDQIWGGKGRDLIKGGTGNDLLSGEKGKDKIKGGDGRDLLFGDKGRDRLKGGDDDDLLVGGEGSDQLWGGQGADVFVFTPSFGHDVIHDFEGIDSLDLTALGYSEGDVIRSSSVENGWFLFDLGDDGTISMRGVQFTQEDQWIIVLEDPSTLSTAWDDFM